MKVQLTLTPAEGKRLIAKAVANMENVQYAHKNGTLIIATSTTNGYVVEELIGEEINKGMFTAGVVTKEGGQITVPDGRYDHYVFVEGELHKCSSPELVPYLAKMGPDDVFIKGANAIDPFGAAGVLLHGGGGGTVGTAWGHVTRNGIQCIIPAGLEKLVPVSLTDVTVRIGANVFDKAMGWPCGMMVIQGQVITEIEAFQILFGVEAVPIAGGGIDGGEGSKMFLLEGPNENAEAAYEYVVSIKGEPCLKTKLMKKPDTLA
ncbi:MAG: hypothetical protein NWF07_08545 [Candidatus Bathyarchaeota archaeon]|nr:hypothetical protein [Candidatus Bathyarchaeota archaeon]